VQRPSLQHGLRKPGIYRSATPQLIVKQTLTRCLDFYDSTEKHTRYRQIGIE